MKRPRNAEPFMASLGDGSDAAVYAIADAADKATRDAWVSAGATVLICDRGSTFPNKCQHAYLNTAEPWLLLVGDDVTFHAGWWQAAKTVADGHALISTNDCGNPYVATGDLAIHPIIRRSWVDESGASWDGPGHVVHEGYPHGWCDWEWTTKAQADGVFVYAPDCVVEHLHPVWQRSRWDDVYLSGHRGNQAGAELFQRRKREFAT